jgi:hypothetical protein
MQKLEYNYLGRIDSVTKGLIRALHLTKIKKGGKGVFLFITKADNKIPEKFIAQITRRISQKGGTVVDFISLTTQMGSVIAPEEFKEELHAWLVKNRL